MLARANGRRGAPRLKRAIAAYEYTPTKNDFERLFLQICTDAGFPEPQVNQWLPDQAVEVDFFWPELGLIVETDGFDTHGSRRAFNDDRKRDRRLKAVAGYEVYRFTWEHLTGDPDEVAETLRSSGSSARRRPRAA